MKIVTFATLKGGVGNKSITAPKHKNNAQSALARVFKP